MTENTFGDILSDIAAAVTGGLGLAASASLGDDGPGIFEPVHGSAPQIAGQGIANPAAMLRSVALLLSHGLGRADEAAALERAVDAALVEAPTPDLGGASTTTGRRRCGLARPRRCPYPVTTMRRAPATSLCPRAVRLRLYGLAGAFDPRLAPSS